MRAYIFIVTFVFSSFACAITEIPVDSIVSKCKPYPKIKSSAITPSHYERTNNLLNAMGNGFYQADGEKIIVYGRLMDKNCVPITDARINIWQNNKKGYAQYQTKSNLKPKWVDPNFNGTGSANTDNLGRFSFITIMPGSIGKITPHINLKIERQGLNSFYSKIYFPEAGSNNITDTISIKSEDKIAQVSAAKSEVDKDGVAAYFIDITLDQVIKNKRF